MVGDLVDCGEHDENQWWDKRNDRQVVLQAVIYASEEQNPKEYTARSENRRASTREKGSSLMEG
jgi:hypothetical protein